MIVWMLFWDKSPLKQKTLTEILFLLAAQKIYCGSWHQPSKTHLYHCILVWQPFILHTALHSPFCLLPSHVLVPPPPCSVHAWGFLHPEVDQVYKSISSIHVDAAHAWSCENARSYIHTRKLLHLYNYTLYVRPMRLKRDGLKMSFVVIAK